MAGVNDFEDLIAWQKARVLTKNIYESTQKERFGRDFGLAGQIQRASVSIMANIAEGFARKNPNEFYYFVNIAKSSASEVRSHLYVGLDTRYLSETEFKQLIEQTKEVERVVGGLLASIDRQRKQP